MARPVLLLRPVTPRRLAKADPTKNVTTVCARLRAKGLYDTSCVRKAIREPAAYRGPSAHLGDIATK